MAQGKFVAYYRVSTDRQGKSGLGLEAQRRAVKDYLDGGNWDLVQEFKEVESGKRNDRPELTKALHLCKVTGSRLLIAKLDRLSRNASFLLNLRDSGVRFVCADKHRFCNHFSTHRKRPAANEHGGPVKEERTDNNPNGHRVRCENLTLTGKRETPTSPNSHGGNYVKSILLMSIAFLLFSKRNINQEIGAVRRALLHSQSQKSSQYLHNADCPRQRAG